MKKRTESNENQFEKKNQKSAKITLPALRDPYELKCEVCLFDLLRAAESVYLRASYYAY